MPATGRLARQQRRQPAPWRRHRTGMVAATLAALAFATRVPLAGRTPGEADCARYLLGIATWMRQGRAAAGIYAKVLSPGYYAAAAWTLHHGHWAAAPLLAGVSAAAAVAGAPLLYGCGLRLADRTVAAWTAVLFLLAPAVWWLGLEAHPQGLSFLCFLCALACFLAAWRPHAAQPRPHAWLAWGAAAALALAAGQLLKNDLVLQSGLFPALAWARTPHRLGARVRRWRTGLGAGIAAAGYGGFLLGRRLVLGVGYAAGERQAWQAVAEFRTWPHGLEALRQLLPLVTAPGCITLIVLAAGLGLGLRRREWRARWVWPLLAACVPGSVFWIVLRGNNVRHMAPFLLVELWAALEGWQSQGWFRPRPRMRWRLGALATGAAMLNLACIQPSSNLTLYPSANVPASSRWLALRNRELGNWLQAQLTSAHPPTCILGNATLPYFQLALLDAQWKPDADPPPPPRPAPLPPAVGFAFMPGAPTPQFIEVNSSAEYRRAAAVCGTAASLEYDPGGQKRRFFGEEWRALPLARHWYPAGHR